VNDRRDLSWPALTHQLTYPARRFVRSVSIATALSLGICTLLQAQAPAGSAQAQAPRAKPDQARKERDQQARTHFELGRGAYDEGRYRDAWAEFREAYRLSQRPELLFNVGQTADRLGEDTDALKSFEMYLERLPNAGNRRDVENRVRALRERVMATEHAKAEASASQAQSPPPAQPTAPAAAPAAAPEAAQKRKRGREARPSPSPPTVAPVAARPPRSWRRGLLLRAAGGLGIRSDSISKGELKANLVGVGFSLDLQAGYAVASGLVVGGGVFCDWSSANRISGDKVPSDAHVDHATLVTLGPFVDWYPKRQSLGLHVEVGLGAGFLSEQRQYTDKGTRIVAHTNAAGISLFVGAGYEWFLGHGLAAGALLRLMGASVTDSGESHAVFTPTLLASLTWF